MFSERTRQALTPNALSLATEAMRTGGVPFDDLTESNPTRVGLSPVYGPAYAALSSEETARYEPDPRGLVDAREAVRRYYAERASEVPLDRLFLTASTSEAYGWLFKLLCDPGDEVLVARPSYPLFDDLARLEGVSLRAFSLAYAGRWELDLDALRRAITPRARAVVLVHPNNPTGSFVDRESRAALLDLCAERGLALIVDEVFGDYAYAPDPERAATFADAEGALTFTLSGLSKVVALPQMKLAWIAVSGPPLLVGAALDRLELIADSYLSTSAPVLRAAASFLRCGRDVQRRVLERVTGNRAALAAAIGPTSRATLLRAEGGWYAALQVPRTRSEEEWAITLLERDRALVYPGWFFDFEREAYLVLSLLPRPEVFVPAVERMIRRIDHD